MSWGFEDNERINRLKKLGHDFCRVPGILIHLDHERSINSVPENPFYRGNMMEFNKINHMSRLDLENYVKTWSWL